MNFNIFDEEYYLQQYPEINTAMTQGLFNNLEFRMREECANYLSLKTDRIDEQENFYQNNWV